MSFLPILLLGLVIGLAGLVFAFWRWNWSPSLFAGIWALLWFAASPVATLGWWLRWRARPSAADTMLCLHDKGLKIIGLHNGAPSMFIPWDRFTRCRVRRLAGLHFSVSFYASTEAGPTDRIPGEYFLCGSVDDLLRFTKELRNRVDKKGNG